MSAWNKENCLLDASQDMFSLPLFPYLYGHICTYSKSSIKTQVKKHLSMKERKHCSMFYSLRRKGKKRCALKATWCQAVCQVFSCKLTHIFKCVITIAMWDRDGHYHHFTDYDPVAQGQWVTCLKSHRWLTNGASEIWI